MVEGVPRNSDYEIKMDQIQQSVTKGRRHGHDVGEKSRPEPMDSGKDQSDLQKFRRRGEKGRSNNEGWLVHSTDHEDLIARAGCNQPLLKITYDVCVFGVRSASTFTSVQRM